MTKLLRYLILAQKPALETIIDTRVVMLLKMIVKQAVDY